jgi:hypothetical protein
MCGSCGARCTCYHWEKQVSSESVGESFLKLDAGGVVQTNICSLSTVKQNFSHSDGWPSWDSTSVIFRLQYIYHLASDG